jgi:hypothetical protein
VCYFSDGRGDVMPHYALDTTEFIQEVIEGREFD